MYFIRHGRQTRHNGDYRIYDLTEEKVEHLRFLPTPDRLVVSPFLRTRQTAEQIMDLLDLDVEWVLEPRFGEFTQYPVREETKELGGRTWPGANSDLEKERAKAYKAWSSHVLKAYQELEASRGEEEVLWIITHSMVLKWVDEYTRGEPRYARARFYPHLSVVEP